MLRTILLKALAYLFDIGMFHTIDAIDPGMSKKFAPTELLGPSGRRRCRRGFGTKRKYIDALMDEYGSFNVRLNTLSSGHKGYASVIGSVRNRMYSLEAIRCHAGTTSAAFHWDGASYSGYSVNVCIAMDTATQHFSYVRPVVPVGLS